MTNNMSKNNFYLLVLISFANWIYQYTDDSSLRPYETFYDSFKSCYFGSAETARENPRLAVEKLARVVMGLDYNSSMNRYAYRMLTKIAPHFGVEIL